MVRDAADTQACAQLVVNEAVKVVGSSPTLCYAVLPYDVKLDGYILLSVSVWRTEYKAH